MGGRAAARVLVISGSVGAGHDGAADELISRLTKLGIATDRRDYLDALPRAFQYVLRDGYRLSVGYAPGFFDQLAGCVHSFCSPGKPVGYHTAYKWQGVGHHYKQVV